MKEEEVENKHKVLTFGERWGLADFWDYVVALEKTMTDQLIDWKEGEERELPIYNQRICLAYAAASWSEHQERVRREVEEEEMEAEFKKEHPDEPFFFKWFKWNTKPSEFIWDGRAIRALQENSLDEREAFLAATKEDFKKLKGVGPSTLEQLLWFQSKYRAHCDFFAKHTEYADRYGRGSIDKRI